MELSHTGSQEWCWASLFNFMFSGLTLVDWKETLIRILTSQKPAKAKVRLLPLFLRKTFSFSFLVPFLPSFLSLLLSFLFFRSFFTTGDIHSELGTISFFFFFFNLQYVRRKQNSLLFLCVFCACHFSSVAQSYPTLCDPMDCSVSGLPVHY